MKTLLSFVLLLGLVGAGAYYYLKVYHNESAANFRTAPIERGDMLPTIEATGSLEPEQIIDIGSQVNGLIIDLKVDYGSVVDKDTVLATIDETLYQATADQNEASVNSAKAALSLAKANLDLAQANLARDEKLLKTEGALAPNQYDADKAACEVAKANVGVQEAAIKQAEAALKLANTNLGYCKIRSPVKGKIVDRRVNVGQTVVSSLSASSLFLLAKDLSRIQVWASVNEADIGRIHPGMKVRFTVDAYPEDFVGEVAQIRLNATMTQNVVTYTVVVTTDNKDLKLLPYMTASLHFEIDHHENVLKVPNAALRWKPRPNQIAPDIRAEVLASMNRPKSADDSKDKTKGDASQGAGKDTDHAAHDSGMATSGGSAAAVAAGTTAADGKQNGGKSGSKHGKHADNSVASGQPPAAGAATPDGSSKDMKPKDASGNAAGHKEHHESAHLWVADGNFVRPVPVRIIATDGTMTEVKGKDLAEGTEVVVGENIASADADADATNPFMPKIFRGGKH
jgi:HlyD family secretion protein